MSIKEILYIGEIKNELIEGLCSPNQALQELQHLSLNVFNWTEIEFSQAYKLLFLD